MKHIENKTPKYPRSSEYNILECGTYAFLSGGVDNKMECNILCYV